MRYLNAQQVAFDHRVEEREFNHALHNDDVVQMEGVLETLLSGIFNVGG